MNAFARSTIVLAAAAVVALPLAAFAAPPAEGVTLKVGDLSQADQAAAFAHRLDRVSDQLCSELVPGGMGLQNRMASCREAVRQEALQKLSPSQQAQFAAYSRTEMASIR